MKHSRQIILAVLAAALCAVSCESFFDVNMKDQPTMEDSMSRIAATRRYLAHLYSYLPYDERVREDNGGVVLRSDEMQPGSSQYETFWYKVRRGDYSAAYTQATSTGNYWERYYIAINQCTTFMNNVEIEGASESEASLRRVMKEEARFLRAYYYFVLFRQYGPVIIWGDQAADINVDAETLDRNTVQENINFMVTELDKTIAVLPGSMAEINQQLDANMGRATKGAAMALKSRILQYAASPLYNGSGSGLYSSLRNSRDELLFPAQYDETLWDDAAKAALDVINLNRYELTKNTDAGRDDFQKAQGSYQSVWFQSWETNKETIWGWWFRNIDDYLGGVGTQIGFSAPRGIALEGYSLITPSLKLVDAFPMWETGRYPVVGYDKTGGLIDLSRPIVDPDSGYQKDGFTENWEQPMDYELYYEGEYPAWAGKIKAHNSTIGRDARYYACLVPNGYWWPSEKTHLGGAVLFTCYNSSSATVPWMSEGQVNRVGYSWRRLYKAGNALDVATDYNTIRYVYPAFRLAEIYFNYAEACNEKKERDAVTALQYVNLVRERSGLPKLEEAYPEIDFLNGEGRTTIGGVERSNKEWLRWMILQEKMVEMCFEGQRHYDMTRWMMAKEEYNTENWTLHVKGETYEDSYTRVSGDYMGGRASFDDRDYLFPFSSLQLAEMTRFTQNPGW